MIASDAPEPDGKSPADPRERELAEILAPCLDQLETGRPLQPAPPTESTSELAQRAQECLPALALLRDAITLPRDAERPSAALPPGRTLGEFTVLRELGRGGMGVVYEAARAGHDRHVALKVLPAHLTLREQSVARFLREAATAARLRHPGIVPILAIGEQDSTHYFAMELVEGAPLDRVIAVLREHAPDALTGESLAKAISSTTCALRGGTQRADGRPAAWGRTYVEAACDLALQVAKALEHAHEAGVVHRDVKPSNILVRPDGTVVLTDFGLAADQGLPSLTLTGEMAGTPFYLAPEQVAGKRYRVDRRADVFALGVTLYELLCLRRPFEGGTVQEVLAAIQKAEPASPVRFDQRLSPVIATIVLTALEKDPQRRYQTAAAFAEDLRAFVAYRPIAARRASPFRRLVQWARREPVKAAFAATAALALVTVVGLGGYAHSEATRAREEAARAVTVLDLVEDMLGAANPEDVRGKDYRLRYVLDDLERGLPARLRGDLAVEARVRRLLGKAYGGLGLLEPAERNLRAVVTALQQLHGAKHPAVATSLRELASTLLPRGKLREAETQCRQALAMATELLGSEDREVARCNDQLGSILAELGNHRESMQSHQRAVTILGLGGVEDVELARSLTNLGAATKNVGDLMEAERLQRRALAIVSARLGEEHVQVATTLDGLSLVLLEQGRHVEAEELARRAHELDCKLLGEDHPSFGSSLNRLASTLTFQGRLVEAETMFRRALETWLRLLGDDHPDVAIALANVGFVLMEQGNAREAERYYRDALALLRRLLGDEHPYVAGALGNLASSLTDQWRLEEAEKLWQEALAMRRNLLGDRHPSVGTCSIQLGAVLNRQSRFEDAERLTREAIGLFQELDLPVLLAGAWTSLGGVLNEAGKPAEAEAALRQSLSLRSETGGEGDPLRATTLIGLGKSLAEQGQLAEAEQLHERSLELLRARLGDEHPQVAIALNDLALVRKRLGNLAGAEETFERGMAIQRKLYRDGHPDLATTLTNLAGVRVRLGKLEEVEALQREALEMKRALLGDEHISVAPSLRNLAEILQQTGGPASEIEELLRRALAIARKRLGDENPAVASFMCALGDQLVAMGQLEEAEKVLRDALDLRLRSRGDDNIYVAASQRNLAHLLMRRGALAEAEQLARDALATHLEHLGEEHVEVGYSRSLLALVLSARKAWPEAEELHRQALEAVRKSLGEASPDFAAALGNLVDVLEAQDKLAAIEDPLLELVGLARRQLPKGRLQLAALLCRLGINQIRQGEHARAEPVLRECLEIRTEEQPTAWNTYNAMSLLGGALSELGRYAEAEPLLTDGYEKMQPPPAAAFRKREALERLIRHCEARGATERVEALRKLLDEGAK
ncbi:MAG TPA: serine/threonine-protein kinase [Planctomycetota bacterium]